MKTFTLQITTPEGAIFSGDVEKVTVPTTEGEVTILPQHVPLMTALGSGDIVVWQSAKPAPYAVVRGFMQVQGSSVVILADFAEDVSNLTDAEIEKAHRRAQELREQQDTISKEDFEHFEAEIERSITRARIGRKWKQLKHGKISINE